MKITKSSGGKTRGTEFVGSVHSWFCLVICLLQRISISVLQKYTQIVSNTIFNVFTMAIVDKINTLCRISKINEKIRNSAEILIKNYIKILYYIAIFYIFFVILQRVLILSTIAMVKSFKIVFETIWACFWSTKIVILCNKQIPRQNWAYEPGTGGQACIAIGSNASSSQWNCRLDFAAELAVGEKILTFSIPGGISLIWGRFFFVRSMYRAWTK